MRNDIFNYSIVQLSGLKSQLRLGWFLRSIRDWTMGNWKLAEERLSFQYSLPKYRRIIPFFFWGGGVGGPSPWTLSPLENHPLLLGTKALNASQMKSESKHDSKEAALGNVFLKNAN